MKNMIALLFTLGLIIIITPSKSFATKNLQAMIDSAEEGATIRLEDKTYVGNIDIRKTITIVGKEKTLIKGDGTGNVISVHAPNVELHHLNVANSSMNRNSSEEYAAIKLYSHHNTLQDIQIRNSYHGVYLSQSHHNLIQAVNVEGAGKDKIASQGNGLHVYYSNHNTLISNSISGTRDGMFFDYANDNRIIGNDIRETRYGLHYMYSDRNEFSNNLFTFNTGGATIMHSNGIKLSHNRFIFNYGHRSFGLFLLSSNDIKVENNEFYLNQRGIYIDQSTNILYRNNEIIKNQIGIELWASSNEQSFTENTIQENTIPAVSIGGEGRNSWSLNKKGNDWGKDFPLIDLDQNGIGDHSVVYQSSLNQLMEKQELTYLFLKSPAIAVYEELNKYLQKETIMFKDSYPLISKGGGRIQPIWWFLAIGVTAIIFYVKRRRSL
ncbi:nitrous oxide reductase family maturation protein NosD [Bacillus massilinigeriensis]|uniref:nitrous oxide reductase family maturation protein NosD n=1 Tax=Bacillus massilionigeriensis TaxID=1805475 RepID=UPI00096B1503|nr:nitrous oxide reductase family maturation protein NosD [Bacillus massilionigeriensis]